MLNLDTHILIHAVTGNLTAKEQDLLTSDQWSISAIVLWEISKLAQLGRIEFDLSDPEIAAVLSRVHVWPIDLQVCQGLRRLDFKSDPADELIAATSLVHQVPLVTRDKKIAASEVVPLA
jgi:PIN domain nuclease of toxin-antitoxin system